MALTPGQQSWLDEQIGSARSFTVAGELTAHRRDGKDHVFTVSFDGGQAAQRWQAPAAPAGDPLDLIGTAAVVGVVGKVQQWRETDTGAELLVVGANGDRGWERLLEVPRPQAELDAERAAAERADAERAAAAETNRTELRSSLDRVKTARAKGGQRTPQETAALIDDLAAAVTRLADRIDPPVTQA